jgi:hypothetical protein
MKPHVLKNLKEINELKKKRQNLEREAAAIWVEDGWNHRISVLHGKMNSTQNRITYLFNLKGVQKALWVTDREEATKIIHDGVDYCWDYNKAINGEKGCSLCTTKCIKTGETL